MLRDTDEAQAADSEKEIGTNLRFFGFFAELNYLNFSRLRATARSLVFESDIIAVKELGWVDLRL